MVNQALRNQEINVTIKMGFFIGDLRQQIEKLHSEQLEEFSLEFTVCRGHSMPTDQFEKLKSQKMD